MSGLTFSFDPRKEVGSRVVQVHIGGAPLEDAKLYVVGTKTFLLEGKDGFGSFDDVRPSLCRLHAVLHICSLHASVSVSRTHASATLSRTQHRRLWQCQGRKHLHQDSVHAVQSYPGRGRDDAAAAAGGAPL